DSSFACLPCGGNPAAQKIPRLSLMIKSLAVASDKRGLHSKPCFCGQHCISIELTQKAIEPRQICYAGRLRIHCGQNRPPHSWRITVGGMAQELDRPSALGARPQCGLGDAYKRNIDPIR